MRKFETRPLYREVEVLRGLVTGPEAPIPVSMASNTPIVRHGWFGDRWIEVLSMEGVNFSRAKRGLPLLAGHDQTEVPRPGNIENVAVDGDKLRGELVFSGTRRGQELRQAVLDDFAGEMSVGYRVTEWREVTDTDELAGWNERAGTYGLDVAVADSWTPLEGSLVNVPADPTVGAGRSAENPYGPPIQFSRREKEMPKELPLELEPTAEQVRSEVLEQASEILGLGDQFGLRDEAVRFIQDGRSTEEFRRFILEKTAKERKTVVPVKVPDPEIDPSEREVDEYNLIATCERMIAGDRSGIEFEISDTVERQTGKKPRAGAIFVPHSILARKMLAERRRKLEALAAEGIDVRALIEKGGTATGAALVGMEHRPDLFIDILRPQSHVISLGATTLPGLIQDISIPKQTNGSAVEWVAENAGPGESSIDYAAVTLIPETLTARQHITRKMLIQSLPAVNMLVENTMVRDIAQEIDRVAIQGSGAGNEPGGILTVAGVLEHTLTGTAITWADVTALEALVTQANADISAMAYLTSPHGRGIMKAKPKDAGSGLFLWNDNNGLVNGYRSEATTHVPANLGAGTDETYLIFGAWASLMIGFWGATEVLSNPYTDASAGGLWLHTFQDADIDFRHVTSFAKTTTFNG